MIKPIVTEKAVMLIETNNTLTFEANKNMKKEDIRKEVEEMLEVKVDKMRTLLKKNRKYAYVRLDKSNPAIDTATKLGIV